MIKLINRITGTTMWVADGRVPEYLERGHELAAVPGEKPEKPTKERKSRKVKQ